MSKGLIFLTATIFLIYGLLCMFFPAEVLRFVIDGSVSSSSGLIDIRATYGGMSLGVSLILYLLANDESTIKIGLFGVLALMGGMAIGRSIGIFVDESPNWVMYVYLLLEMVVASLSIIFLKGMRDKA